MSATPQDLTPSPAPKPNALTMAQINQLPTDRQFPKMLEAFKAQISAALPSHLNPERMVRLALTAFRGNSKLALCEPLTVFSAVIVLSQLGLEIGVDGQAYIVPYYDKRAKKYIAQPIPGWKGYVELINRAKQASIWTGAVFEGDEFDYQLGARPDLKHKPKGLSDETKANLRYVYCVGWVHGAEWPIIEVWPVSKVQRHLNRNNKVGDSHYALANDNNFIQYGKKVALMQVQKYLPKSVELRVAEALDHGAQMDLRSVIEGEFTHLDTIDYSRTIEDDNGSGGGDAGGQDEAAASAGAAAAEGDPATLAQDLGAQVQAAADAGGAENRSNAGRATTPEKKGPPKVTPDSAGKAETPKKADAPPSAYE